MRPAPRGWWHPGIGAQIGAIFVILALLGGAAIFLVGEAFAGFTEAAVIVDQSGRLRMLSQRILLTAYHAVEAQPGLSERGRLHALIEEFEIGLRSVEKARLVRDGVHNGFDHTGAAIANLRVAWSAYRGSIEALAVNPSGRVGAAMTVAATEAASAVVLDAAESVVRRLLIRHEREREQLLGFATFALFAGLLAAAGAYLLIRWRIVRPIVAITAMGGRFTADELDARIDYHAGDEIGRLVKTLNASFEKTEDSLRRMAVNEKRLEDAERKFRSLVEGSLTGVYILGDDGLIEYANPRFASIFGYTEAQLAGCRSIYQLAIPACRESIRDRIRRRLDGGETSAHYEFTGLRSDGTAVDIEVFGSHTELDGRRVIIGSLLDVSQRKRQEERLAHNANHDALTGLPNRNLLLDRIEQAIAFAHRHGRVIAVLHIDLDFFKYVNDTLGHAVGDTLLCQVAERLRECVRENDTVARVGGDEFVLVLTDNEREEGVALIAERILAALAPPVEIDGHHVSAASSVGASLFPRDARNAEALLQYADIAMYRAKESGRNNFQFYTNEMQERFTHRASLESRLRNALDRQQFRLYYQPQIDLANRRIVGAEALIRWNHPELGMVMPAQFIPLAEETGLIVPIGEWVLGEACAQSRAWRDAGLPPVGVAVNLSARQFRQKNLVQLVAQAVHANNIASMGLELELTESMVMHDPDETIAILSQLKEAGLRLSLDDFGTGYSSLSYLQRFPIDVLKIDRSFISDIERNPDSAAITAAIISLAHGLELSVVAEGVETEAQLQRLDEQRCDIVQGYFFSRPLPAAAFGELLRRGLDLPSGAGVRTMPDMEVEENR